ncbi:tetratricopeptide repeat protein [Faunimonas pinastri]|nr:tetratricopeptide repeat protein [Faunimonas pinastri]
MLFACATLVGVAHAFDPGSMSPSEAFRTGYAAYKKGDTSQAIDALNYAASKGHAGALWKLGQMYATGDGVTKDDSKALKMFSQVADDYADGNPHGPDAPFVADAFVALGTYYQRGIPGSVEADVDRARRYYLYAASYFGDSEAQYQLACMYLNGTGGDKSPRQAARWYKLAAEKGHAGAQAQLGMLLFQGVGVARNPIKGLMWLSIARLTGRGDPTIQSKHEEAFSAADETERRTALALAEDWMAHKDQNQSADAQ